MSAWTVSQLDARRAARARHPSVRPPVPTTQVADRVCEVLTRSGVPWPEEGAAVLADRGITGLGVEGYARALGIDPDVVVRAESGALAPTELPGALQRVIAAQVAGS